MGVRYSPGDTSASASCLLHMSSIWWRCISAVDQDCLASFLLDCTFFKTSLSTLGQSKQRHVYMRSIYPAGPLCQLTQLSEPRGRPSHGCNPTLDCLPWQCWQHGLKICPGRNAWVKAVRNESWLAKAKSPGASGQQWNDSGTSVLAELCFLCIALHDT